LTDTLALPLAFKKGETASAVASPRLTPPKFESSEATAVPWSPPLSAEGGDSSGGPDVAGGACCSRRPRRTVRRDPAAFSVSAWDEFRGRFRISLFTSWMPGGGPARSRRPYLVSVPAMVEPHLEQIWAKSG
jgi:hypothetical protein